MQNQLQQDNKEETKKEISEVTCWVDELGFLSLGTLLIMRMRHPIRHVKYLEITKCGKFLIRLKFLRYLFCIDCYSEKNLVMMTFADDTDVLWRTYEEPSRLVYEIMNQNPFHGGLLYKLSGRYAERKEKIELFFKQRISDEIRPYVKLSNIIQWHHTKQNKVLKLSDFLLIKYCPWFSYLKDYNSLHSLTMYCYPHIKNNLSFIFNLLRILGGIILNSIYALMTVLSARQSVKKENNSQIAVLYVQGADLEKKCDFFWFPESGLEAKNILIYFRVPYRPMTDDVTQLLKEYGMNWINLVPKRFKKKLLGLGFPEAYLYPSFLYVCKLTSFFFEMLRLFIFIFLTPLRKLRIWEYKNLVSMLYHTCFYESVFAEHGVKVHCSLMEGEQLIASDLGADLAGAVNISNHWSNYPLVWVDHGKSQDVYFAWGPFYRQFFQKDYYLMKYLIYGGFSYDRTFKENKSKAMELRSELRRQGASFIMSFFDEVDCFSREDFEKVYKNLLEELYTDSTVGLIIKPKRLEYYHRDLKDIFCLIEKAQETGRCLLLDEAELPNMAAQASDIAIGLGVVNTAALEAALAGVPTVVLNYGHMNFTPLYKMGIGKIVFENIESLMPQIRQFRNSKGHNGFADYSPFLEQIDPFRDGNASQRMGRYIKWVFDEMCQSANKIKAIEKANERYRQEYGADKIFEHHIN